jgi:hypothetical protein
VLVTVPPFTMEVDSGAVDSTLVRT